MKLKIQNCLHKLRRYPMIKLVIKFLLCFVLICTPIISPVCSCLNTNYVSTSFALPVYDDDGNYMYDSGDDEGYDESVEESENNAGWFNFDLGKMITDAITGWIVDAILKFTDFFLDLSDSIVFPEKSILNFRYPL